MGRNQNIKPGFKRILVEYGFRLFLLFFLSIATVLVKMLPIHFSYGITVSFSSFFLFLILWLYGPRKALVVGIFTYVIGVTCLGMPEWSLFFAYIPFLIILACFWPKNYRFFWAALFLFLSVLFCSSVYFLLFNHESYGSMLKFSFLLDSLNDLFNLFFSYLAFVYIPFDRWMKKPERKISINHMLFHLTVVAVIISFFILLLINSYQYINESQKNIQQIALDRINQVNADVSSWNREYRDALKLFGTIQENNLDVILHSLTKNGPYQLTVTNDRDRIISSTNPSLKSDSVFKWDKEDRVVQLSSGFYEVIPSLNHIDLLNWRNGFYVFERHLNDPSLIMYVAVPLKSYQNQFICNLLKQLLYLFIFIGGAYLFSLLLQNILTRTLNRLAVTTTGLPERIKTLESIEWPVTRFYEISSLINNFKDTSRNLALVFNEMGVMNTKLKQQTECLKLSENRLQKLAYFDILTELPNRQFFQEYIRDAVDEAGVLKQQIAILFLDLDQFKHINDTLGHSTGDDLLKNFAGHLKQVESTQVKVFRLGGDEFVIVVQAKKVMQYINDVTNQIRGFFSKPIRVGNVRMHLSCSVGVSLFPKDGSDRESLIQHADIAMYDSKTKTGTTIQFFDKSMKTALTERIRLTDALREAIQQQHFELYYQPKVDNQSGYIKSVEALIRWNRCKQTNVYEPSQFIPVAEETGLILKIDEWAISEACKQNKKWQTDGFDPIQISVNISAQHFYHEYLIKMIENALRDSELEPKYLQLEITESVFIKDFEMVNRTIRSLRELGVSISIDDFGKGYSSLNHLLMLPINEVKLDKFFVQNINNDTKKAKVVEHAIRLSHDLNYRVIAEGVETREELHFLRKVGCDGFQGYLFSRPVPRDEVEKVFNDRGLLVEVETKALF